VGRNFDCTKLSWLKKDETTKQEVRDNLGEPFRVGVDEGQPSWTYGYYKYRLIGNSDTKDLVLRFGPDDKLKSYTLNTTFEDEKKALDPSAVKSQSLASQ
jgi:hypothetical protein